MAETENQDSGGAALPCSVCGSVSSLPEGRECAACLLLGALGPEPSDGGIGRLGQYELLELLARGGMGVVYRAQQKDPAREVALKALPGGELHSPEARQRFRLEAEAMARLEHPAILPVYEWGEEDATPFFTMKLATGGSLAEHRARYAGDWRATAELLATVAEAVHFAHDHGVLHRDIKPGNILFDEAGQPFVSDFGLAKMIGSDSDLTRTLALIGTPNYMAPERITDAGTGATVQSDVWSLGVILCELLAGQPPFTGGNIPAVLREVETADPPPLPPAVPRDLRVVAFKALAKKPTLRFESAAAMAMDLRRWLRGDPVSARTLPAGERLVRWTRRHPWRAAVAVTALAGVAFLAWMARTEKLANERVTKANAMLRDGLAKSLLERAALERSGLPVGRRKRTLALVQQAVESGGTLGMKARQEAASALSLIDLEALTSRSPEPIAWPESPTRPLVAISPNFKRRLNDVGDPVTRSLFSKLTLRAWPDEELLWTKLTPHAERPQGLAVSDSGKYAAALSAGFHLKIWNTATDQLAMEDPLLRPLREGGPVPHLFHLHGTRPLAAGIAPDGTAWVQNLTDGTRGIIAPDCRQATALRLNPAADRLAIALGDAVEEWDVATGQRLHRTPVVESGESMLWTKRGLFVTERHAHEVLVIREGAVAAVFRGHASAPALVSACDQSWEAVSVDRDGAIYLWDARDGQTILKAGGHPHSLQLSTTGTRLITGYGERGHQRWAVTEQKLFGEYDTPEDLTSAGTGGPPALSADGRCLATFGEAGFHLWSIVRRQRVAGFRLEGTAAGVTGVFTPDSGGILVSRPGGPGVLRFPLTSSEEGVQVGEPTVIPGTTGWGITAISPDGKTWGLYNGEEVALLEVASGTLTARQPRETGGSFSPDLRFRFQNPWTGSIAVRAAAGGEELTTLTMRQQVMNLRPTGKDQEKAGKRKATFTTGGTARFSPGGAWFLTGSFLGYSAYAVDGWRKVHDFRCNLPGQQCGQFAASPDGRLGVFETHSDGLRLHSMRTGEYLINLHSPRAAGFRHAAFSTDSRKVFILTARHRLYEWDLDALQEELKKLRLAWEE